MWLEHIKYKESLLNIYGYAPSIEEVVLHEIRIHHDGPHLGVRFDLKDFPKDPPSKWVDAGYNRTQVQLELWSLDSIHIDGFQKDNIAAVSVKKYEKGLAFSVKGTTTSIIGIAGFAFIQAVTAYKAAY